MAEAIRAVGKHLAIDERHHHVDEPVVGFAQVDDVADIRMLEPHAEARLSPQTSHRVGVVGIGGSAGRATGHYARTWFRPPDLARYSASSARANSSSVVSTF